MEYMKESEDENSNRLGHSPLGIGKEISSTCMSLAKAGKPHRPKDIEQFFVANRIKFRSAQTTMNSKMINVHLRVLKRLTEAAEGDTCDDNYSKIALWHFDKMEQVFGRKHEACTLQESIWALDSFQAALPSNTQLYDASENLHVLSLRGYRPIASLTRAGHIQEVARALALYSAIPKAILPRLPKYETELGPFKSLRAFHNQFPKGFAMTGDC